MRLYLDDNILDRTLTRILRKAGHMVVLSSEAGREGFSDPRHLLHAIEQKLVFLTQDYSDFTDLHDLVLASGGTHPGILLIYSENDPTRDMTPRGIGTAIAKLEASGITLASQLQVLNQWR